MNLIIYNNQSVDVTYNGQLIVANSSYTASSNILDFANDSSLASDVEAGLTGLSLVSAASAEVTGADGIALLNTVILTLSTPLQNSVSVDNFPSNTAQETSGHLASLDSKLTDDSFGNLKTVVENFPSNQTVDGTVSIDNFPTFPSNQVVSGTVTALQGTTPWSTKNATNSITTPVTLSSLDANITISTAGYGSAIFAITGTYVGQLVPEVSLNGTNWFSVYAYNYDGAGGIGGTGLSQIACAGYNFVRLRMASYTSGTANIIAEADAGSNIVQVWNPAGSYNFPVEASQADDSMPWFTQAISNAVSLNLNGAGQTIEISTAGYATAVFAVSGTWVGTLSTEVSLDNNIWYYAYPFHSGSYPTGNDLLRIPCSGFKFARLRVTSYTSGTINIAAEADAGAPGGMVVSPTDGQKNTYSVSANINPPNNPTDIFTISAGTGKTVKVLSIKMSGTQNTAGNIQANLILRSSLNSGGTPHALSSTPHDPASATSTATVNWYSVNPTSLGSASTPIRADKVFVPAPSSAAPADKWGFDFGNRPGQAITLRGSQLLALNLNGNTTSGGNFNCSVEYTEE